MWYYHPAALTDGKAAQHSRSLPSAIERVREQLPCCSAVQRGTSTLRGLPEIGDAERALLQAPRLRIVARHPFIELGEIVSDLPERCLGGGEEVNGRSYTRIIVERARRDHDTLPTRLDDGDI